MATDETGPEGVFFDATFLNKSIPENTRISAMQGLDYDFGRIDKSSIRRMPRLQ